MSSSASVPTFGECCEKLNQAFTVAANSMFRVEEDNGVLYLSVGYTRAEDGRVGWFDLAVMYCPFCGAKLQDGDEIRRRALK